jgi:lysophospholipase L1-like esterase
MEKDPLIRRRLASALLLAAALPGLAAAQTTPRKYLAFGDSITAGVGDDPARAQPGYPPRLENLLQTAGVSATVLNFGVGGEKTPDGLSRINSVLAQGSQGDVLLLMEGTNDVTHPQNISPETTIFDLDEMARRAEALNLTVFHATLIPRPPWAKVDADNTFTDQLNGRIRNLAGVRGRHLADPNQVFHGTANLFAGFYSTDPTDFVGHPNTAGYDILAHVWFDVIQGLDTVPPVPGIVTPLPGASNVSPTPEIDVDVWDFGDGIDLDNTFLLINGQQVPASLTGTTRQVRLSYQTLTPLTGTVHVGLRSRDLAVPANAIDRDVALFTIRGTNQIQGDLNGDGRVDGTDLVLFGLHFGAQRGDPRYDPNADFNADGSIDGLDLAILASSFGQTATTP